MTTAHARHHHHRYRALALRQAARSAFVALTTLTVLAVGVATMGPAMAQGLGAASPAYRQMRLTQDHIARYIAVSRDLLALADKLKAGGAKPGEILDAQERERDAAARAHGFAGGAEHQAVDWNIWLVIAGLDRKTGDWADPIEPLRQQIAAAEADTSMAETQRRQSLDILRDELAALQPLEHKENIALVKRYFREIDGVRLAQFMIAIEQ
jgi:hypothetical protein